MRKSWNLTSGRLQNCDDYIGMAKRGKSPWNATAARNKDYPEVIVFRPRHIIQATGVNGDAWMPKIDGIGSFQGDRLCHSTEFSGASQAAQAKRVVVVGTGVSGHDIPQEYYEHGDNVTMIQRSPTCIDTGE